MSSRKIRAFRRLVYPGLFLLSIGGLMLIEWVTVPNPIQRHIHLRHFRYGTDPAIIRANRGDELVLTFATEDTGHSFFLQDYQIDAKISPSSDAVLVYDPFKVTNPPRIANEVHITAGRPGFLGSLISVSRFRCHVYCGPMHGFEQGDLVVRPNWLFAISIGSLLALFLGWLIRCRYDESYPSISFWRTDLNRRYGFLARALKWRPLQFILTIPVLAFLVLLILAGLFGTKVGGRNIAVMFTWACWMPLLTWLLIPLGGRIWCLVCPLPVLGEYLQRGATIQVRTKKGAPNQNRYFGLNIPWPGTLTGPWIKIGVFLILSAFSASLAGQPRWTAVVLLLFMALALVCSLIWERRSFCRYVCPASNIISLYSPAGRLMVRARNTAVCGKCIDKPCFNGNGKGWGCPYGLTVQNIKHNRDCGLCLECFKACPHDNVSLAWGRDGQEDGLESYGDTWQAIVMLTLAVVYSLVIHSPWPGVRDVVNVVDKTGWVHFAWFTVGLWMLCLVLVPLLFWSLNCWGAKRSELQLSSGVALKRSAPSLIPLGLGLWAAFFAGMFMPNLAYILMTLSDPFGWGWDLLGTSGMPWLQLWPGAVPWIQAALVLLGFHFSLEKGYRLWYGNSADGGQALSVFFPVSLMIFGLSLGMLIYFTWF